MIKIPALPKCSRHGDHSLIRIMKTTHSFKWQCLACNHLYTVYRLDVRGFPADMVYERTEPDAEGKFIEMRVP